MNYILIINFSVRFIITILIFVLIRTENDFIKLAELNTLAQFLIGFIGFQIALNKFGIKYTFPERLNC